MRNYRRVIISIIVILILLGVGSFYYTKAYADPFNRSFSALSNMLKIRNEEITCDVKFSLQPEGVEEAFGISMEEEDRDAILYANSILESSVLKIGYKSEMNKSRLLDSKFQYSMDWLYEEERLLDFIVKMDEELIEVLAPSLLNQVFYMTKNELYDELGFDLRIFELEKYLKIIEDQKGLLNKIDKKVYLDILRDEFEEKIIEGDKISIESANGKKIRAKEYTVLIHYDEIMRVIEQFKVEIKKEEAFKAFLRETILKILKEAYVSSDYKIFHIEEKTFEEMISNYEDEEKFETMFYQGMNELDEFFEEIKVIQKEMDTDYKVTYAIDWRNEIRGMNIDLDYGFLKVGYHYIFHSINEEPDFIEVSDMERTHIAKIADMDGEEINEVFDKIILDIKDNMITNKALGSLMMDLQKNSYLLSERYKSLLAGFFECF